MSDSYTARQSAGTTNITKDDLAEQPVVARLLDQIKMLEAELQSSKGVILAQKHALKSRARELSLIAEKLDSTAWQLQELEAQYHSIVEAVNEGIWVTDTDARTIFVNRRMGEMLGYPPHEMIGRNLLDFMGGEGSVAIAPEQGRHHWTIENREFKFIRRDGSPLWVISNAVLLRDRAGLFEGTLLVFTDITGRKRAEDQLIDARAQAELYLDLMGHDINNMHQIAMGYLELARETIELDDAQRALIDGPYEVLQKASRLIDNVRKLQRARSGNINEKVVDLDLVLAGVAGQYEGMPCKLVQCYNDDGPHYVKANDLLQDVFLNLIGNAIKHSNGSRVKIHIGLGVLRSNDRKFYRVYVEDNGPGIPGDVRSRIFNRLKHGDSRAKGIGIGLHLVRSIVESYNGRVWVEDRVPGDYHKGSRFVVTLPAYE